MSAPERGPGEIARGLASALTPALRADAPSLDRMAARDVAQLLGLSGLDAVLAELDRHAGPQWPRELQHVAARILRLAESAVGSGDAGAFFAADRELEALARGLHELDFRGGAPGRGAIQTLSVAEALEGLPFDSHEEVQRARLTAPVAASLRAALDWLGADVAPRLHASVHDTALTLTTEVTHEGGIAPAGAVLGAIEGSLGRETDGRWTLRAPLHVDRSSYLLLRQGRLALALPWHSIARLRMLPPHEITRLAEPVLPPLATPENMAGERPAALVALGLTRAWFMADRIVWRVAAVPEDADVPGPFSEAHQFVSIESGERYWVVDGPWLLRGIAAPDSPPTSPRPRSSVPAIEHHLPPRAPDPARADDVARAVDEALSFETSEPAPPAAAPARTASAMFSASLTVLRPEHVQPRGGPSPVSAFAAVEAPAIVPPAPAPAPPTAAPAPAPTLERSHVAPLEPPAVPVVPAPGQRPSEIAARNPAPRALIADDSLVARIFLSRLLERRGYIVEAVGDASAMWAELGRGPWAIVLADLAMPDASGRAHIERLLDFRAASREPFTVVVLTRDAADEEIARGAGARLCLRKPFEAEAVDDLLSPRPDTREDRR